MGPLQAAAHPGLQHLACPERTIRPRLLELQDRGEPPRLVLAHHSAVLARPAVRPQQPRATPGGLGPGVAQHCWACCATRSRTSTASRSSPASTPAGSRPLPAPAAWPAGCHLPAAQRLRPGRVGYQPLGRAEPDLGFRLVPGAPRTRARPLPTRMAAQERASCSAATAAELRSGHWLTYSKTPPSGCRSTARRPFGVTAGAAITAAPAASQAATVASTSDTDNVAATPANRSATSSGPVKRRKGPVLASFSPANSNRAAGSPVSPS